VEVCWAVSLKHRAVPFSAVLQKLHGAVLSEDEQKLQVVVCWVVLSGATLILVQVVLMVLVVLVVLVVLMVWMGLVCQVDLYLEVAPILSSYSFSVSTSSLTFC
jgi:hypothetical protein